MGKATNKFSKENILETKRLLKSERVMYNLLEEYVENMIDSMRGKVIEFIKKM